MGRNFIDRFSLLHLATGIISYYWGISESVFLVGHVAFEFLENTDTGMRTINAFPYWPGGKTHADSYLNMVGDTLSGWAGWRLASMLDTKPVS